MLVLRNQSGNYTDVNGRTTVIMMLREPTMVKRNVIPVVMIAMATITFKIAIGTL